MFEKNRTQVRERHAPFELGKVADRIVYGHIPMRSDARERGYRIKARSLWKSDLQRIVDRKIVRRLGKLRELQTALSGDDEETDTRLWSSVVPSLKESTPELISGRASVDDVVNAIKRCACKEGLTPYRATPR